MINKTIMSKITGQMHFCLKLLYEIIWTKNQRFISARTKDLLEFSFDRCKCSVYYIPGCLNCNYVPAQLNADDFVNSHFTVFSSNLFPSEQKLFVFHYLWLFRKHIITRKTWSLHAYIKFSSRFFFSLWFPFSSILQTMS